MNGRRALSILVGFALAIGLGFSRASASSVETPSPWLAPTPLGLGQDPVVAASARGDVVVAWYSVDNGGVVRASFRPAGGRWQPVIEWPSGWGIAPRVAIDRKGDALVAWIAYRDGHAVVDASLRPAGRRWEAPTPVSDPSGWASSARVGMDAAGNALVAWRADAWPEAIQTRYRSAETGTWEPAVGLTAYAYSELALAMAPGGRTLLAWDVSKDVPHVVVAAVGEKGHWGEPRELGGIEENAPWEAQPKAIAPAIGDSVAVVAWQYAVHGNGIVRAAVQRANGQWEPAVDLSFTDGQAFAPAVVVDGGGNILTAWDANVDVEGSTRRASAATWERPIVVSPSRGTPVLAANARGDAVAVWQDYDSSPDAVQAARKPATSATWDTTSGVATATRIDTTGVAIDGAGDAIAVWEVNDGRWWVEIAASDVSAPVVTKLVVPRTASAHRPIRFSVTARDTWSRVTAPVWAFGDGARARGSTVTHWYRSAGPYRVTVAVADALGHTTTDTRSIRVRK